MFHHAVYALTVVLHLSSFIHHSDIKDKVPELEGGDTSEGGTHHAGVLQHLLYSFLLALPLLLRQAAQL